MHFCMTAVRLCTFPRCGPRTGATSCVHKPGRSRSALYTRCTIPKTHTPVHQGMGSKLAQTAFSYTAVRLCTAPSPVPHQAPLAVYTNLEGSAAPCTLVVRLWKPTCQFTRPWGALWCKRHLHTPAVRLYISGTLVHSRAISCVHKPRRSRSALYINCTIVKTHMSVHQAMRSTVVQTASSYTRC